MSGVDQEIKRNAEHFARDRELARKMVHGGPEVEVETASGPRPSFQKMAADALLPQVGSINEHAEWVQETVDTIRELGEKYENLDEAIAETEANRQASEEIADKFGLVDSAVSAAKEQAEIATEKATEVNDVVDGAREALEQEVTVRWNAIAAMTVGSRLVFETLAELHASSAPTGDALLAEVWRDTKENNGLYGWTGSAWEKSNYDLDEKIASVVRNNSVNSSITGAIFIDDSSPFTDSVGDHTRHGGIKTDGVFGWKCPFQSNGVMFNVVLMSVYTKQPGGVDLTILSSEGDILATAHVNVSDCYNCGTVLFALDRYISLSAGEIGYIQYVSSDNHPCSYPFGGEYDGIDPSIHREYYRTATGWRSASPVGNYRINYRFVDTAACIAELRNIPSLSADIESLKTEADKTTEEISSIKTSVESLSLTDQMLSHHQERVHGNTVPIMTENMRPYHRWGGGSIAVTGDESVTFNTVCMSLGSNAETTVHCHIYMCDTGSNFDPIPSNNELLVKTSFEIAISSPEMRKIHLGQYVTIPANKSAYILFSALSGYLQIPVGDKKTGFFYSTVPLHLPIDAGRGEELFNVRWGIGNDAHNVEQPILLNELVTRTSDGLDLHEEVENLQAKTSQLNISVESLQDTTGTLSEAVESLEQKISSTLPVLTIPDMLYATVGVEFNLYYDALVLEDVPVQIYCAKGRTYNRCYRLLAKESDIGTHNLKITIFDKTYSEIMTKTVQLVVLPNEPETTPKIILQIGDSLNSSGQVTKPLAQNFVSAGGVTPIFVGSVGTGDVKWEAFGGWTFERFCKPYKGEYRFYVTGAGPIAIGNVFTNNSSKFRVTEVNTTDGTGNINTERVAGSNVPTDSGVLTIDGGSEQVTYTRYEYKDGNNLWNPETNSVDIAYYRENIGLSEKIDIVTIQLGINDIGVGDSYPDSAYYDTVCEYGKTLITAFNEDNPDTLFIVGLPCISGKTKDGFGTNYGSPYSYYRYEKKIFNMREALLRNLSGIINVTIAPIGIGVDRQYGYPTGKRPIAARIPTLETVHTNAVHPATPGYEQMADMFYPVLKKLL